MSVCESKVQPPVRSCSYGGILWLPCHWLSVIVVVFLFSSLALSFGWYKWYLACSSALGELNDYALFKSTHSLTRSSFSDLLLKRKAVKQKLHVYSWLMQWILLLLLLLLLLLSSLNTPEHASSTDVWICVFVVWQSTWPQWHGSDIWSVRSLQVASSIELCHRRSGLQCGGGGAWFGIRILH